MYPLEIKTKDDFKIDPLNLQWRSYQKRCRIQMTNYLYREKMKAKTKNK